MIKCVDPYLFSVCIGSLFALRFDFGRSPLPPSSIVRGHNFRTDAAAATAAATIYEIGADNAADNLTRRNGEEDEVGPLLVRPRDSPFMGTGLADQMRVGVQRGSRNNVLTFHWSLYAEL